TGTPTFLVKWLRQVDFDLRRLSGDVLATPDDITDYRVDSGDPIPILYQSGYLTIKGYDKETGFYVLGFPNEEVEYGFLKDLVPACIAHPEQKSEFYAGKFIGELIRGDVDGFMARLRAFFADMPYELSDKTERHYQTMFYLVFKLMGQLVQAEHRSARGRADAVVVVRGTVYVFEFKLAESATAEDALRQIDEKGYLIPFTAGERKVVKVGAEFSAAERTLSRWVVA
ncbi:MAG: PD-(D/E)XK nuclease domain-containing protein, partial [Prevotellaceae bacterium]|nr:PD-(D/E)XK nuclease domain-containing protein [Prevotellaceae bacterium]